MHKISVENDVLSSAVNTSDNEENAMEFKVGDEVELVVGLYEPFALKGSVLNVVKDGTLGARWINQNSVEVSKLNAYSQEFKLMKDTPKAQDNSWYENGDIPPVGANIEYKLGAGPWFEAIVKYVLDVLDGEEDEIVIACPHLGFEQLLVLDKYTKIRPIQTPEQIAAQERKKAIDAISDVLIEAERMSSYTDVAAHLYESGLRFVEEEVE